MTRPSIRCAWTILFLLAVFCSQPLRAQEPAPKQLAAPKPAYKPMVGADDARLREALNKKGHFEFIDESLSNVAGFLSDNLSVDILVDAAALDDIGLGADTPVSISIKGVTARSMLRMLLHQLDLTWIIRDEAIVITTLEAAESQLKDLVYPIGDLMRDRADGQYTSDELIELITRSVAPDTWDEVGGPGSIAFIYGMLLISQTEDVHEQIQQLLDGYRAMRQMVKQSPDKVTSTSITFDPPTNQSLRAALDKRHSLDVVEAPLSDVVALLSDQSGMNILLDERALDDIGIGKDTPVTDRAVKATLRTILNRILRPLELTYVVRDEVLVITSLDESEHNLQTRLYPIYDLPPSDSFGDEPYGSLISALTATVDPTSWDEVGGPASITAIKDPPVLVVSQTEQGHHQVGDLLQKLRLTRQNMGDIPAAEQGALRLQVYPLPPPQPGAPAVTTQDLARVITRLVEPDSWADKGVLLEQLPGKLIIRQTERGHYLVQKLLQQLGVYQGGGGFGGGGGGGFGGGGGGFGGGNGGGGGFFSVP